jgi:hypothetical protein
MNPTDVLASILKRAGDNPSSLADQDRHVLYQILIQHGLTVDSSDGISSSLPSSDHFGSNPSFVQRNATEKFSQTFYFSFSTIINVLTCEIQLYNSGNKNFELLKEALSAFSYLFSGFWISETLRKSVKKDASVKTLLYALLNSSKLDEQVTLNLKSSILSLTRLENREVHLILLFLLSKQQAYTFFLGDIICWLQFLHKLLLQFCRNASSSSSLYEQVQLLSSPSHEVIHCLEGFEKLLSAWSESGKHNVAEAVMIPEIPENIILFFLNQFISLIDLKGKKNASNENHNGKFVGSCEHNEVESENEESFENQRETERLLISILQNLPPSLLKNHLTLIVSRYCLHGPKVS